MKYFAIYEGPWNCYDFDQYRWVITVGTRKEASEYTGLSIGSVDKSLYYDRPIYNLRTMRIFWFKRVDILEP